MGSAPSATLYLSALIELLSDEEPSVRLAAAVALGQVGPSADRGCARLIQLLSSAAEAEALREAAAVALGAIDDVAARAEERTDKQTRAHIEPIINALVAACASDVTPDGVRMAAMMALRRVVHGAWRLSSAHADALRPLVLGERAHDEAAPAEDVRRCAQSELYPLFMEAVRGRADATWRLARSRRTAASAGESYGMLVL
jgi:HEAT repeat protein